MLHRTITWLTGLSQPKQIGYEDLLGCIPIYPIVIVGDEQSLIGRVCDRFPAPRWNTTPGELKHLLYILEARGEVRIFMGSYRDADGNTATVEYCQREPKPL